MELLGCGCLLGLLGAGLALPIAILINIKSGKQKLLLHSVNVNALSEGDLVLWQSYDANLQKNICLQPDAMARINAWPKN